MVGISLMNASSAGFLSRISTLVILVLGISFLKERFNKNEAMAGLIVLVGLYIVKNVAVVEVTTGFWWIIISSVLFGVVEIIAKIAVQHVLPQKMNAIRNCIMGVAMISWGMIQGSSFTNISISTWVGLTGMAIVGPLFARMSFLIAYKHLEVSKVTLVSQLQPIFVVILSVMILKENPSLQELLGGALITLGSAGVIIFGKKKTK